MRFFHPFLLAIPGLACAADMRSLIEQYSADAMLFQKHWEGSSGSGMELNREQNLWEARLKLLGAIPFADLDLDQQVDYLLMRHDLESTLEHLRDDMQDRRSLMPWLPFLAPIESLTDSRVLGKAMVPRDAAATLAPVAKSVRDIQGKLKAALEHKAKAAPKTKGASPAQASDSQEAGSATAKKPEEQPPEKSPALPTPYEAARSADAVDRLTESLKKWFANYEGFLPEFHWWIQQPYDETTKALEAYAKFLREEVAEIKGKDDGPLIGRPVGKKRLMEQLTHEFIPYTPEELIAIGEREFAWCEQEMKRNAAEMQLGDDWKAALAKVKADYVLPGEQEALVRAEGKRSIAFAKDNKLVTVPPGSEEWWGTRMLSAQEQKQIPYAAYSGHDMLVAFAGGSMSFEDKLMAMRGNNRAFMHNVVPHELIPGHHLQNFMAARYRPYRRGFSTPFLVEGWGLYWEMRYFGLGYDRTPQERIGALFWRMHRCARIIVSLKFHLGEMKPNEMVDFLVDKVGHERLGATSEVRRFITGDFAPLYQAAYMIGGLQQIALQREMVGPGKMTEQQFHDAVLRLGPIPVELIRASLLKQPLTPDYKSQWHFDAGADKP